MLDSPEPRPYLDQPKWVPPGNERTGWPLSVKVCVLLIVVILSGGLLAGVVLNGRMAPAATAVAATEPTAAPAAGVTASTLKMATVQQIASIVAKHEPDLRKSIETAGDCRLLTYPECGMAGRISYLAVSLELEAMTIYLSNVDNETKPNVYQGEIPDELRLLVADTLKHARAVKAASDTFQDLCVQEPVRSPSAACVSRNNDLHFAINAVEGDLNAWSPYL